MLASVALLAVTSWLVKTSADKKCALYTGVPTVFMFAVTLSALGLSIKSYVFGMLAAQAAGNPVVSYVILIMIAALLIVLAVSLIITACRQLFFQKDTETVKATA